MPQRIHFHCNLHTMCKFVIHDRLFEQAQAPNISTEVNRVYRIAN